MVKYGLMGRRKDLLFDGVQWRNRCKSHVYKMDILIDNKIVPNIDRLNIFNFVVCVDENFNEIEVITLKDFIKNNMLKIQESYIKGCQADFDNHISSVLKDGKNGN